MIEADNFETFSVGVSKSKPVPNRFWSCTGAPCIGLVASPSVVPVVNAMDSAGHNMVVVYATELFATEDGFYLMPQAGVLLPLGGLNHFSSTTLSDERFRTAQFAWTGQLFAGIQF